MCSGTEAPESGNLHCWRKGRRRNNGHCSCMAECSLSDCPGRSLPANCDHFRSLNNASAWFSHIRQLVGMCFRPSEKAADAPPQLPSCMWTAPKFPHALGKKPSIMESRIVEQLTWDRIMGQHERTQGKSWSNIPQKSEHPVPEGIFKRRDRIVQIRSAGIPQKLRHPPFVLFFFVFFSLFTQLLQ